MNVPCVGYMGPHVVIESSLLLAWSYVGLTLRLADGEAQPQPWNVSCCASVDNMKWNLPQKDLVPAKISFWLCL